MIYDIIPNFNLYFTVLLIVDTLCVSNRNRKWSKLMKTLSVAFISLTFIDAELGRSLIIMKRRPFCVLHISVFLSEQYSRS